MLVMRDRLRTSDQIALNPAPCVCQKSPLLLGLDALGNDRQAERPTESQGGVDDGGCLEAGADLRGEALVDLDLVEWKGLQIGQRRIAGPEIVHGEADAEILDPAQDGKGALEILEQHALGDLDF